MDYNNNICMAVTISKRRTNTHSIIIWLLIVFENSTLCDRNMHRLAERDRHTGYVYNNVNLNIMSSVLLHKFKYFVLLMLYSSQSQHLHTAGEHPGPWSRWHLQREREREQYEKTTNLTCVTQQNVVDQRLLGTSPLHCMSEWVLGTSVMYAMQYIPQTSTNEMTMTSRELTEAGGIRFNRSVLEMSQFAQSGLQLLEAVQSLVKTVKRREPYSEVWQDNENTMCPSLSSHTYTYCHFLLEECNPKPPQSSYTLKTLSEVSKQAVQVGYIQRADLDSLKPW